MASDIAFSAIRAYLAANWSGCPLSWENETFTPPSLVEAPGAPANWAAVTITGTIYDQASIGTGASPGERWIEEGAIMIDCFVQSGTGSLVARQTATALANLLRGQILTGAIRMQNMSIGDGAAGLDNGDWWGLTLRIDWLRG